MIITLRLCVAILCVAAPLMSRCAAEREAKVTVIKPFFAAQETLHAIRNVINQIERDKKGYPDYDGREGITWNDFWIQNPNENPVILDQCPDTVKGAQAAEKFQQRRNPESIFDYEGMHAIVTEELLPKILSIIKEKQWEKQFPSPLFTQLYVQRCSTGDRMEWHQDPGGEDYKNMAHYSLVLMLSDHRDPQRGWRGGSFNIKPGLPGDNTKSYTIDHEENQGILLHNQENSHSVEPVIGDPEQSERDLIVVALYLDSPPIPLHTQDDALEMHQTDVAAAE